MHIGEKIKAARESIGMTAKDLAKKSNIYQPYLSRVEKGKATGFKVDALQRICAVLDMSPNELLEWEVRKCYEKGISDES